MSCLKVTTIVIISKSIHVLDDAGRFNQGTFTVLIGLLIDLGASKQG